MNKYLKLSIFFTALWIFIFSAGYPLYFYIIDNFFDDMAYLTTLPFTDIYILDLIAEILFYGSYVFIGCAIITGTMASQQTIKSKSKWASVALILAISNALFLFGVIYASWGI
ncbi:MAG: hypothetical protein ABIJ85_01715 [bacterium]